MSMQRYNPYGTPSLFNVRNARMAYNAGQKIGGAAKKAYNAYKSTQRGTPIKTTHSTKAVKKVGGRGYKKVHKDKITNKHARKAIANVVKTELNKELELKRTTPNYVDLSAGISHRVWYTSDVASSLGQGDGMGQYSGEKVHLTSVNVKGWLHEQVQAAIRGLPTRLEFYLLERKGNFAGTTPITVWGNGMWSNTPEDQIVKSETAADNTIEGRFAKIAPQKRRFKVLGKKIIYPKQNNRAPLGTTEAPVRATAIDFTMKIDKTIKPYGLMAGEEISDLPRVFLAMRAFQGEYQGYGAVIAASGQFQTQLFFRDA